MSLVRFVKAYLAQLSRFVYFCFRVVSWACVSFLVSMFNMCVVVLFKGLDVSICISMYLYV